jgi:hypothetical protein
VADAHWTFWLGCFVAGAAIYWIISANLRALGRYRGALDGRAPSLTSRVAWLMSLLGAWTGPFVILFAALAIVLGLRERGRVNRGLITRRSLLPAQMAIKNGAVLLGGAVILALLIWVGWSLSP